MQVSTLFLHGLQQKNYVSSIMEVLRNLKEKVHEIVFGRSVSEGHPVEISLVSPSRKVFLLLWTDSASDDDIPVVQKH